MLTQDQQSSLKELLDNANSILVMVDNKPSLDYLACAAGLALSLSSYGKEVTLLSPQSLDEKYREINGFNLFTNKLGKQNLVAAFDYKPDAVDKVSYHIGEETKKFYLTVKPKKGAKPLNADSVEFFYTGAEADLIFLVGVHQFKSLELLHEGFESLYQDTTIVTIHNFEPDIGNVKIDTSSMLCNSEALFDILDELELPITAEIASNLYMALQYETKNFTSLLATADTFEIAAELIRSGAKRSSNLVKNLLAADQKPARTIAAANKLPQRPVSSNRTFLAESKPAFFQRAVSKNQPPMIAVETEVKKQRAARRGANAKPVRSKLVRSKQIRRVEQTAQTAKKFVSQKSTKVSNLDHSPSGFVK